MREDITRLGALVRFKQRMAVRQVRGRALIELLRGNDVDPSLIEPLDRQRTRAQLLHLETLSTRIGQDPSASRRLFEAVIGKDDTLPRRFLTYGEEAARAIGLITVRTNDGAAGGTGSLVSQHLVITNNHVLASEEVAQRAVLELGYYELDADTFPSTRQIFRIDPGKFFFTSEDLDFTLVGVETDNGSASTAGYGSLDLFFDSGKALLGERVNIIHHAGGRPQMISIRENTIIDVFDEWIHYMADTAPGSSGAPVFNDEWQLVAIHHASVPIGGSDEDGGIVNEGIRISAILRELNNALS